MGTSSSPLPPLPPFVRDAAHTLIGFGVLGFQRAQVVRREVTSELMSCAGTLLPVARSAAYQAGEALAPLAVEVEKRVPEPGRTLLRTARVTAQAALRPR